MVIATVTVIWLFLGKTAIKEQEKTMKSVGILNFDCFVSNFKSTHYFKCIKAGNHQSRKPIWKLFDLNRNIGEQISSA